MPSLLHLPYFGASVRPDGQLIPLCFPIALSLPAVHSNSFVGELHARIKFLNLLFSPPTDLRAIEYVLAARKDLLAGPRIVEKRV